MTLRDIAIIGGGPAGLAAAAALARQLHTAVVFDSKQYRNAKATAMHMVPGHEGKSPEQFRLESREGLSKYPTIEFHDGRVDTVEKKTDCEFLLTDSTGKNWQFRKLLLAVGCQIFSPTSLATSHFGASASSTASFARATRIRGLRLRAFSPWRPSPFRPRCWSV